MSSIDVAVLRNSAVAEENRKRHTNADSAFQTICTFMDLIYGQQLDDKNLKSCCKTFAILYDQHMCSYHQSHIKYQPLTTLYSFWRVTFHYEI